MGKGSNFGAEPPSINFFVNIYTALSRLILHSALKYLRYDQKIQINKEKLENNKTEIKDKLRTKAKFKQISLQVLFENSQSI